MYNISAFEINKYSLLLLFKVSFRVFLLPAFTLVYFTDNKYELATNFQEMDEEGCRFYKTL